MCLLDICKSSLDFILRYVGRNTDVADDKRQSFAGNLLDTFVVKYTLFHWIIVAFYGSRVRIRVQRAGGLIVILITSSTGVPGSK